MKTLRKETVGNYNIVIAFNDDEYMTAVEDFDGKIVDIDDLGMSTDAVFDEFQQAENYFNRLLAALKS